MEHHAILLGRLCLYRRNRADIEFEPCACCVKSGSAHTGYLCYMESSLRLQGLRIEAGVALASISSA